MQICHEHSRLTLNSTSDYRKLVVGAMCLDCYPKMQKTSQRGNTVCYITITILILVTIVLVIMKVVEDNNKMPENITSNPEVYDPAESN